MRLVIRGRDLPGAACPGYDRIGVGLQVRSDPVGVVVGNAADARWETDVTVAGDDFRGPAVHGKRGERFVYLTWGDLSGGGFEMFRRAKLMLSRVDPALVAAGRGRRPVPGGRRRAHRREGRPAVCPGRPARRAMERGGGLSRQASGGRSL